MGQLWAKYIAPPKPTAEEAVEIKKERDAFYADLKTAQENYKTQQENNDISPDTYNELMSLIKKAQEWLRGNPTADQLEVKAQRDDLLQKATPIFERERDKNRLLYWYWYALFIQDFINSNADFKKQFFEKFPVTRTEQAEFNFLLTNLTAWFRKNPAETGLTYREKFDSVVQNTVEILGKYPELTKSIQDGANSMKTDQYNKFAWWEVKKRLAQFNVQSKQAAETVYNNDRLIKNSSELALQIFFGLLLFALILFGASIAANMAISREWYYRVFYFVFGCNPILTPFILIYAALQALKGKPVRFYGVLPIDTEPAKTRLGKILGWPFFYEPDQEQDKLTKDFLQSLTDIGNAVKNTPMPAPGAGGDSKC